MPAYTSILRSVTDDKFSEILNASPRKSREIYFHRHGIKAPASANRLVKPGAKNEARAAALRDVFKGLEDDQLAEEILRIWLLGKRDMLAKALDHLGIVHDHGLTDSDDVSKIEKLSGKELKDLVKALDGVAPKEDIVLYLKFMGAADVEKAV